MASVEQKMQDPTPVATFSFLQNRIDAQNENAAQRDGRFRATANCDFVETVAAQAKKWKHAEGNETEAAPVLGAVKSTCPVLYSLKTVRAHSHSKKCFF